MHPLLTRGSRLALYLLVWAGLGAILAGSLARPAGVGPMPALALVVPLALVYGFVCLSSWYVCKATPIRTSRATTLLANVMGATIVASGFWLTLGHGVAWVMARLPALRGVDVLFAHNSPMLFLVVALAYLLTAAASYAVLAVEESRATEQRALEMQLLAREAELKTLRAQIAPHFLFNSLHSINALTTTDPPAARRMCLLLAEFLRASLRLGLRDRVPFGEELALTRRFFEIEQVRFGGRLATEEAIEPGLDGCAVPPLLLQPLAENAVAHGISGLVEGGTIRIEARRADAALEVAIENPYDRDRPPRARTGVGLENVRRRLATRYGGAAGLREDDQNGRFRVTVTVPWDEVPGSRHE
jgi:two-component system sensor histidine kinase AlgZ